MAPQNAVFAPIEDRTSADDLYATTAMKRPLEEAAELFRENEACSGSDREKANLYRGLSLLSEALARLENELAEVESEIQGGPSHFYQEQRARSVRNSMESATTPVK